MGVINIVCLPYPRPPTHIIRVVITKIQNSIHSKYLRATRKVNGCWNFVCLKTNQYFNIYNVIYFIAYNYLSEY